MKTCYSCKLPKALSEFTKDKSRHDRLNYECRSCSAERYLKGGLCLRETKRLAAAKRRRKKPEESRKNVFDYYHRDLERSRKVCRERRQRSLKEYRKKERVRAARRYKKDPGFRLRVLLSNRIFYALRETRTVRSLKTMELLGCTITALRIRLEDRFKPGMTWANHGPVWHVDHIKPCAKFDLTNPEQQKICFHYTNLQPLFAAENISKGAS